MKSSEKIKSPKNERTVSGLRLPEEIYQDLQEHAEQMERTLVAQIRVALREWCKVSAPLLQSRRTQQNTTIQAPSSPTGIRPAAIATKPVPNVQTIIDDEKGWEHGN